MLRNRLIWLGLWLLSLVGITFYGGVISYGFFAAVTLVPIVSLIYLAFVYEYFRILQTTEGRDFVVNQTIPFRFSLINDCFVPFVGVRVKYFSSFSTINGLSDEIEYELKPKTSIEKETNLICHYRGTYKVGIKSVEIQDYFRLFKLSYRNKSDKAVIILPQLVELERIGDFDVEHAFKDSKANKSENDLLSREYISGDDTRLINWSQSGRLGKLMVRNKIGQDNQGVSLLVDTCRYSENDLEYIPVENKVLEIALAVSLYLCERKIDVTEYHYCGGLISNVIESGMQFENFYGRTGEIIYSPNNRNELLFEEVLKEAEVYKSVVTFMVVAQWNDAVHDTVKKLVANGVFAVVFYVGDKKDVPDYIDKVHVKIFCVSAKDDLKEVLS